VEWIKKQNRMEETKGDEISIRFRNQERKLTINQGDEDDEFWQEIGGKVNPVLYIGNNIDYERDVDLKTKLYKISIDSDPSNFEMISVDIKKFSRSLLVTNYCFILDYFSELCLDWKEIA